MKRINFHSGAQPETPLKKIDLQWKKRRNKNKSFFLLTTHTHKWIFWFFFSSVNEQLNRKKSIDPPTYIKQLSINKYPTKKLKKQDKTDVENNHYDDDDDDIV